ncbi:hypothetical protein JB92DRAFT_2829641 [Gautieria morchelliformis]|nr:hypothetical protein JB92DRAFT_2829641 [Gautieria morchelliformis]
MAGAFCKPYFSDWQAAFAYQSYFSGIELGTESPCYTAPAFPIRAVISILTSLAMFRLSHRKRGDRKEVVEDKDGWNSDPVNHISMSLAANSEIMPLSQKFKG